MNVATEHVTAARALATSCANGDYEGAKMLLKSLDEDTRYAAILLCCTWAGQMQFREPPRPD